mgnify:CR=1 FL=1
MRPDGDAVGSPGSLLTFFVWPGAARGRQGAGQVGDIGLMVPRQRIGDWVHAWEASGLDAPALTRDPGGIGLLLYYGLADRSAIGLAESRDGIAFVARAAPVVRPADLSSPIFREVDRVASPFAEVVRESGAKAAVRLWIAARGRETGEGMKFGMPVVEAPNFSVAELASTDGRAFVPFPWNPVLDRAVQFLDHRSELDPALVTLQAGAPGLRALLYRGASADESGAEPVGLAIDPPAASP